MPVENLRIEKYQYEFHTDVNNGVVRNVGLLYLYGRSHELLAAVAFLPGTDKLEKPTESPNGYVSAQMNIDRMPLIIDTLRSERPVYFCWSPERESVRITTQYEPVGEQELKRLFSFLYI